ncbi:MAG TPA: aldehyde dehydrogenase family protein [Deltaproteobacteria bacterium]|nr:aldehyde dehydrogenase family protein [Deltaproteobacteria bacterium]HPR54465.1 aldehyde dehydrogenase family protein [Deltaproteobacteria bacterium]HXK46206.1 aldehyde dehydrogenase family protein [Deltaproteobacteria bacterium]
MERYQMFIDGKFTDADTGETRPSFNPATEEPIALVPVGTRNDAKKAVEAARRSFDSGAWSRMKVKERARILMKVVEKLAERTTEIATIESMDSGATFRKASLMDLPFSIEHFRTLIELGERVSSYEPLPWNDLPYISWNFVHREPIGVCAGIIPWNFPLLMAVWKTAPALIMGNSLVLKPASDTPLSALELGRIMAECDLPPGVFNVITGPGSVIGEELCTNPMVDKVALTGSTETGRQVMKLAADTIKKVTLELGGKSPSIVLEDANLDVAVDGALFGTFFHAGQVCESGTRCFVHDSIYDEFMERAMERIFHIKVGDPMDPETTMGPVVSKAQHDTVLSYIDVGKKEGARCAVGGHNPSHLTKGYYVEPTIFEEVKNDMTIAREEIFGPVLSVIRYRTTEEAITMANDSIYGLGGAVFSRDIPWAIEVAKQIRTGTVWINDYHLLSPLAPFGGYKQSGVGRELGPQGLLEFTQVKHIHVDLNIDRSKKFWYDYLFND